MNQAIQIRSVAIESKKSLALQLFFGRCSLANQKRFALCKTRLGEIELLQGDKVELIFQEIPVNLQQEVVSLQGSEPFNPSLFRCNFLLWLWILPGL